MNNPWEELKEDSSRGVFTRAGKSHPLDFFWARDPSGRYMFLFDAEQDLDPKTRLPSIKGIDVTVHQKRVYFALIDKSKWMMFYSICEDLMRATRLLSSKKNDVVITTLIGRLSKWQELLGKKRKALSEAEIKGLIGELTFLLDHLSQRHGIGNSVSFWTGPKKAQQDFSVGDVAYEVKCQEGVTEPYVKISSEFQLCTQLNELYLYVVTVSPATEENKSAVSLGELISTIRKRLMEEAPDEVVVFEDLLMEVGVLRAEEDDLADLYQVIGERLFHVGEGFPRLCTDNLSSGIKGVSYRVSLSEIDAFSIDGEWFSAGE